MPVGFVIEQVGDHLFARGELDADTSRFLDAAVSDLDGEPVFLDLSAVTFIDSAGLRALLRARQKHRGLRVVNPRPEAAKVFEMTGLTQVLLGDN